MKIAQINSFFYPVVGGVENHILAISKELIKLGHDVTVLTSDFGRSGRLNEPLREVYEGIKIKRFKSPLWFSDFTPLPLGILAEVLFGDYDVIHIYGYRQIYNLASLIAKLRGKKSVLLVLWPEYPKELRSGFINSIIPVFDATIGRIILKFTDRLIAHTPEEATWLKQKFGREKNVVIIPPGIEKRYLDKISPKRFISKYNLKGKIVLYMGRIHKSKGIDKLIKISGKFKNVNFVIAGGGPHLEEFKKLSDDLGAKNVLFTGPVSENEKLEALAACDIFCHPTNYDSFGITLIEAMAQGKAVVSSNIGGIPSVVKDCGLLFEKDDLADLQKKLEILLGNRKMRENFGKNGKEKVKSLTWEKLAKKMENLYNSI